MNGEMNDGQGTLMKNRGSGFKPYAPLLGVFLCVGYLSALAYTDENAPHTIAVLSGPHTIDRIYKSMEGITGDKRFELSAKPEQPELFWVTAGKVDMFKEEDGSNGTGKFLCHAYLKFDDQYFTTYHRNLPLGKMTHQPVRLFTFVQGQPAIHLPRGYGIPVLSSELFEFEYMVINPTQPERPFAVKTQGTFAYVRDGELEEPLKPLFMRIVGMHVRVKQGSAGPQAHCSELGDVSSADLAGQADKDAEPAKSSLHKILKNEGGFDEVYHWMVPPGRHQYRYQLESKFLANLPFDTTVHYINAHLHPHGEFIELRDLTTGQTVFRSSATNNAERSGLTTLTDFSSDEGVVIRRDHQYEMVAEYDNTTDHDIDAMAILFLYLRDQTFDRERLRTSSGL